MAGTISLALSQRSDAAEGRLYWYRAGTVSTPQNAFYDAALTLPLPNPLTLDADGNIPFFFLADGSIKVVLIDRHGTTKLSADNIPVYGSSSGGGGGGTVDPTTVWQTGDAKLRYGTGVHSGFVRANGRTIGSATSGATERANSDCQSLFLLLYADPNLTVSPGPRTTAAADWAANKTIALPDVRHRVIGGLGDMGNSNAALLDATMVSPDGVTLGAHGGVGAVILSALQIPVITPTVSAASVSVVGSALTALRAWVTGGGGSSDPSHVSSGSNLGGDLGTISSAVSASGTPSITMNSFGGGSSHLNVQPTILMTIYIKL